MPVWDGAPLKFPAGNEDLEKEPDDLIFAVPLVQQLFHLIYGQPDIVRLLARQAGWQDVLTRLYVLEAATDSGPPHFLPELPTSSDLALSPPPPPELPAESSDVFLPSESPCPDPDAFYHALSPFSTPFDLGLERASIGSGNATAGGSSNGTITPSSQPGTPSPLDGPRPFPTAQGRHSSSLSNVLEDGSLLEPTISGDDTSNTSNPQVRRPPSDIALCLQRSPQECRAGSVTFPKMGSNIRADTRMQLC